MFIQILYQNALYSEKKVGKIILVVNDLFKTFGLTLTYLRTKGL